MLFLATEMSPNLALRAARIHEGTSDTGETRTTTARNLHGITSEQLPHSCLAAAIDSLEPVSPDRHKSDGKGLPRVMLHQHILCGSDGPIAVRVVRN